MNGGGQRLLAGMGAGGKPAGRVCQLAGELGQLRRVGGQRGGERGRGAPGKTPFVAAVETTPDARLTWAATRTPPDALQAGSWLTSMREQENSCSRGTRCGKLRDGRTKNFLLFFSKIRPFFL